MLTYQQLDTLADSYSPILVVASLILPFWTYRQQFSLAFGWLAESSWGLCVVYGLMALDQHWLIWPRWGLDYSTHTGFAWVLAINLCRYHYRWPWALSLLGYCALMKYQGYHTWSDMLTTALAVSLLWAPGLLLRRRYWPMNSTNELQSL